MTDPTPVTDYLATLPEADRAAYEKVLETAHAAVPDLREGTGYGMAALTYRGKPLLGIHAATQHLGLYPFSGDVVGLLGDELSGFERSKGAIRFTAEHPLPVEVVRDLVRLRANEIDGA